MSERHDDEASSPRMIRNGRGKDTGRPLVLTPNGRGTAVLLDVAEYQALLEENKLLRDVQRGLADVSAGRTLSHAEARERLLARFRE